MSGDTPYSFTYEISNYYTHPSYDDTSSANDIAVIITRSYILFNRGVTVICLPRANEPLVKKDANKSNENKVSFLNFLVRLQMKINELSKWDLERPIMVVHIREH